MRVSKIFFENKIELFSVASFLLLWEFIARLGIIDKVFISSPSAIILAGTKMLFSVEFFADLSSSVQVLFLGFFLAILCGVSFGFWVGRNYFWYDFFKVYIFGLNAVPMLALMPLLILWFGLGMTTKVVVVFLITLPPIIINTIDGVRMARSDLLEMAQAFEVSEGKIFRSIIFFETLPHIFSGLKVAVGRSVLGLVIAEVFGYGKGLGYLVSYYGSVMQTDRLLFVVTILLGVSIAMIKVISTIEKRIIFWK